MKRIKLGKKRFKSINEDLLSCYEITNFSLLFGAFLFVPVLMLIFLLTNQPVKAVFDNRNITVYAFIIIAISGYITLGSRLLKRKVFINRETQMLSSAMLFSIGKREDHYYDMGTRAGTTAQNGEVNPYYLCAWKVRENSKKKHYVDYIKFGHWDEWFLSDLEAYMNYTYSGEKSELLDKRKI